LRPRKTANTPAASPGRSTDDRDIIPLYGIRGSLRIRLALLTDRQRA
jgi:hypothetical protein